MVKPDKEAWLFLVVIFVSLAGVGGGFYLVAARKGVCILPCLLIGVSFFILCYLVDRSAGEGGNRD